MISPKTRMRAFGFFYNLSFVQLSLNMHSEQTPAVLMKQTTDSLQRIFNDDGLEQCNNYEQLKESLTSRIIFLLLNEMEKLLHILYRIDVNEKKVKEAFAQNNPKNIAPILAELIIERETQKVISRHRHR